MVPNHRLACPPHWFSLSAGTRHFVLAAYHIQPGGPQHTQAVTQAVEELRRNHEQKEAAQ
jgi:hypothetical protein